MLDQDNNFYLISLSILIACLLDNVCVLRMWRSYTLITFGSYIVNKAPDFPTGEEKLGSECSL